jgi:hypothetical protein
LCYLRRLLLICILAGGFGASAFAQQPDSAGDGVDRRLVGRSAGGRALPSMYGPILSATLRF